MTENFHLTIEGLQIILSLFKVSIIKIDAI